jgi:thiosulfate/3-mercaptopyruvate sulfurtransferase
MTDTAGTTPLIDATALADLLTSGSAVKRPVLLDVRWTLAGSDRDGYLAGHLPGAVFIDLDRELAGPAGPGGRHPLPAAADLQRTFRTAGIDDDSPVVVYDGGPGLAAARAWWLLRWSGLADVRVLDGGLAAWTADPGRHVVTASEPAVRPGSLTVRPGGMAVVDAEGAATIADGAGLLVDARAGARFRGEIEPLDPIAGHIPGSVNLPMGDLLTAAGTFRSAAEIATAFDAVGLTDDGGIAAASCGSGVTACQLILAGELAGRRLALYPGSYSQWCALGRPVATGS